MLIKLIAVQKKTMPTNEADCLSAGYFWYNGFCNGLLPSSEADCLSAGYFWYNDICNVEPKDQKYFLAFDQTKITGTLDSFLLTLTGDVLPAELMSGEDSSVDGSDIVVYDENMNRIPSHVRYFDKANSLFEINVNIPTLTTTTTGIYISWGDDSVVPEPVDGTYGQYATYGADAWMIFDGTLESSDPWLLDLSAHGRNAYANSSGAVLSSFYRNPDDGFLGKSLEIYNPVSTSAQMKIMDKTQSSFAVSISMWVKYENTNTVSDWIFLWRTGQYYLGIQKYQGGLQTRAYASGVYLSKTGSIRDGLWHHLALTRNDVGSKEITLYVDGVEEGVVLNKNYSSSNYFMMFYGGMNETKFTNIHFYESQKSGDWIKTTYDVHINLSAFITSITPA